MIYPINIKPTPRIVSGEHKGAEITAVGISPRRLDIYTPDTVILATPDMLPYGLRRSLGAPIKEAGRPGPFIITPEELAEDVTYDPDSAAPPLDKPEPEEVEDSHPKERKLKQELGTAPPETESVLELPKYTKFPPSLPSHHPKEKALEKMQAQVTAAAGDIVVRDVEPTNFPDDDMDDEGISPVAVTFDIKGKTLAQLLGKQARVLEKALKGLSTKEALRPLGQGGRNPAIKEILKAVRKPINKAVNMEARDAFNRGARIDWKGFSFADDDSYWSAKVDPAKGTITYEVEFDVMWKWT